MNFEGSNRLWITATQTTNGVTATKLCGKVSARRPSRYAELRAPGLDTLLVVIMKVERCRFVRIDRTALIMLGAVALFPVLGCSRASNPSHENPPTLDALSQAEDYCNKIFKSEKNTAMMAVFGNSYRECYMQRSTEVDQSKTSPLAPGVQAAQSYCEQIFGRQGDVGMMTVFKNSIENCVAVRASELASTIPSSTPPLVNRTGPYAGEPLPTSSTTLIKTRLQPRGGTFVVPVLVNEVITLDFVIDSGASDVSIPADVVLTLMRTGSISPTDFLGEQVYRLVDGSTLPSLTFRIKSLRVGGRLLLNVTGSVAPVQGSLLLGQSFLSRFRSWSIDNHRQVLILE